MIKTAYKFMKFDLPKSIGIIVGIVISIFLIGQQLATLGFITRLMTAVIVNANTHPDDIWVVDNLTNNVNALSRIDSRLIREIRSMEGVENTYGILVAGATLSLQDGKTTSVTLIGSDGPEFIAGPNYGLITGGKLSDLNQSYTVSGEFFSTKSLGTDLVPGKTLEINKKNAIIKVQTRNAQGYGGNIMYASLNNVRFYSNLPPDKVSIVLVRPRPGHSGDDIIQRINSRFFGVKAWTADKLKNTTISDLLISSNMGVSFGSLVGFAMISGFFIIGLTLYSSALDRLKDYGTLKAIGATNGYVTRLILTQAMLFAFTGFTISWILLVLFQMGVSGVGLIIKFDWPLIGLLFGITLFMSVGGSLFAIRKISKLEPASIF